MIPSLVSPPLHQVEARLKQKDPIHICARIYKGENNVGMPKRMQSVSKKDHQSELVMVVNMNFFLCSLVLLQGRRNGLILGLLSGLERVFGVLFDEGDEALEGAVTVVVKELAGTSGLELERGEARDTEGNARGKVVLRGLHLRTTGN